MINNPLFLDGFNKFVRLIFKVGANNTQFTKNKRVKQTPICTMLYCNLNFKKILIWHFFYPIKPVCENL